MAALMVSSCGLTYEDWDKDGDGIEPAEFSETLAATNFFANQDMDNDGYLSEEETYSSLYNILDEDEDGFLNFSEWALMREYYQENMDQEFGEFAYWDANDDDFLIKTEFYNGLEGNRLFKEWDIDENYLLSPTEFELGLFNAWDSSNDEIIDRREFNELAVNPAQIDG